jgi:hypothetical protein
VLMISKSVVTFLDPAPYGRWVFGHFRGKYCLHLQGNWIVSTSTWTNSLWPWRHYKCSSKMLEHLTATWFRSPEGVNHLFNVMHYLKCYILKCQYVKKQFWQLFCTVIKTGLFLWRKNNVDVFSVSEVT